MFEKIIRFSIHQRWLVLALTVVMAGFGIYNFQRLAIDAVPDITNVQVQINTEAVGYTPLEVEQRITFAIETGMAGLPQQQQIRSISRYGLSQVTVVFNDGIDIYFARQLVSERLQQIRGELPGGIEPVLGPVSTGLGEIFMWTVDTEPGATKPDGGSYSLMDLRELQDWVIKPQLVTTPGVTEINTLGGYERQFHVTPDPQRLMAYQLDYADIVDALLQNNNNAGAGFIERNGEQYLVRSPGQVATLADIENVVVTHHQGIPVFIKDVGEVLYGKELRGGAATQNGHEVVLGTAFLLMGENSREVARAVADRMSAVNDSLPPGVVASTVYDRTELVDKTIATVRTNLTEGALLVIAVLFVFLGNMRAAILTALVIPLSMLFTITGMVQYKVSANLMSLGALDFGIIVDGAVVIVENCMRRLRQEQQRLGRVLTRGERFDVTFSAAKEVRRVLLFGQLIIMAVYLPIFALTGVEGKMFTPMAFTVVAALLGATVLSVTFVPAAVALCLNGKISEKEHRWFGRLVAGYCRMLKHAMANTATTLTLAVCLLGLSLLLTTRMGSEFIPKLDEGDIALQALRIPSTGLEQSLAMQKALEKRLLAFEEVELVFSKIGTAEVATDPMPPNIADTLVMLKEPGQWPDPGKTKAQLVDEINDAVRAIPGNNYEFSQPIAIRFNELISGVRADVAVKIFGDDPQQLLDSGQQVAAALSGIAGTADVSLEQITGLPVMTVKLRRNVLARYGLNSQDVQQVIQLAMGGQAAGEVYRGDRRFELVVRLPESLRRDADALQRLPIAIPSAQGRRYIPLSAIADISLSEGPNQISRENGKRRMVVSVNVRGRDLGSFVKEAQAVIAKQAPLPSGYWLTWGGQYEQLMSASQRLQWVLPLTLLMVLMLLFVTFGNLRDGLLVFSGVPFAMSGGILALWLRDIPLSISAAVGFIALCGIAVLNGLVLVSFIKKQLASNSGFEHGHESIDAAIVNGALARLRPVLMTALVAALGFIPMALATGTGAEVQRPLATVVIGGILSSTLLTLLVLPVLYRLSLLKMRHRDKEPETGELGTPQPS